MCLAALVALTLACGTSSAPTSPSSSSAAGGISGPLTGATVSATAASVNDPVTLKVTAPTPLSPLNNQKPDVLLLLATAAVGKFVPVGPLLYRFLIIGPAGTVVQDSGLQPSPIFAGGVATEVDRVHTWVVRAEFQGAVGPWSAPASFIASNTVGYIRGAELYDPLVNGATLGEVHDVTFIPGQGVRLNSQTSYIKYRLQQPLHAGELSVLVSNIGMATSGLKTKVFSMSQGDGDVEDITTDRRRFTVEKRGGKEPGDIAWRVIANEGPIETIGNERLTVTFQSPLTYFWRATWDTTFRLTINEGGVNGGNIYDFSRALDGTYDPDPHFVYLGSPPPRGGPDSQSVPGIILRQLWVSRNPRPAFANQ